jgi:fructokinase
MIICCGEAVIDFLPAKDQNDPMSFQALTGGSIYNVAIALGRLGRPVGYCGGLSTDFFGDRLRLGLRESGVDLSFSPISDRSSTLAFVQFNDGEPSYAFIDEGSAARMLQIDDLPVLSKTVTALHFGSISLIHDPAGATLEAFAHRHHGHKIISLDPNIRAEQVQNREAYLQRLNAMITIADIIKLSDIDLEWIAPGANPNSIAAQWLEAGAKIIAITKGGEGAIAYTRNSRIECAPEPVVIADTIGAGDTFMAGLLSALDIAGLLNIDTIEKLDTDHLEKALNFAMQAARITISRPGANPPWAHELKTVQKHS